MNILSDRYLREPLAEESFMADIKSVSFSRLLNGNRSTKPQLQYQSFRCNSIYLKLGVAQDLKVRGGANGLENLKTTGGGGGGGGEYYINSFCSIYTYIYIANKI